MEIKPETLYKISWIFLILGAALVLGSLLLALLVIPGVILLLVWIAIAVYWIVRISKGLKINAKTLSEFGIILFALGLKIVILPDVFGSINWVFGIFMAIGIILLLWTGAKRIREGGSREYNIGLSAIGLLALIFIMIGIIMNVVFTFLLPEFAGLGNYFFVAGFGIGVIGLFLYVIKEKAFKD